ncbi:hypothetical protein BRAS3843_120084 [Bradyrhizobium sp. STM 3843]|nr:hypothetical protein BRAS3843_120084 [Bradyrhizobium sp. STM 3843]
MHCPAIVARGRHEGTRRDVERALAMQHSRRIGLNKSLKSKGY